MDVIRFLKYDPCSVINPNVIFVHFHFIVDKNLHAFTDPNQWPVNEFVRHFKELHIAQCLSTIQHTLVDQPYADSDTNTYVHDSPSQQNAHHQGAAANQ